MAEWVTLGQAVFEGYPLRSEITLRWALEKVRLLDEDIQRLNNRLISKEEESSRLSKELEALLSQPRERASLLIRRLDDLEALRRQAELHARHLALQHEGLAAHLDTWALRVDAALCARIVA